MPFSDVKNTACLTCTHVLNDALPILFVSHDADDGSWQFLCNVHTHDETNIFVVALLRVLQVDGTIEHISDLPLGFYATRAAADQAWVRQKNEDEMEEA